MSYWKMFKQKAKKTNMAKNPNLVKKFGKIYRD